MPPSYASQSFWDARFTTETAFEWLGDGETTLVPALREHLRHLPPGARRPAGAPPATLHIGAGTSRLGAHVIRAYDMLFNAPTQAGSVAVVNTDFVSAAVERRRAADVVEPGPGSGADAGFTSAWEQADAMCWADMAALGARYGPFAAVVDKSTADAIACGADVRLDSHAAGDAHPALARHMEATVADITLEPLQVLALHLAALVAPGGCWFALSYSAARFPFLNRRTPAGCTCAPGGDGCAADAGRYWEVERVLEVEAPSGQEREGVHAPAVMHYVYVLRRTEGTL